MTTLSLVNVLACSFTGYCLALVAHREERERSFLQLASAYDHARPAITCLYSAAFFAAAIYQLIR